MKQLGASETQNLISTILPMLEGLGWDRSDMEFEVPCAAGRIDVLYKPVEGGACCP